MNQRGFITGPLLYALIACGLAIAGLSVAVWGFKHKAEAAEARLADVVGQRDRAIAAAKANEEAAKRLVQLNEALNAAIVERDKRAKALEETRRKLRSELDELKRTLPAEDQGCLDRGLPLPLVERLRDGPSNPTPSGPAKGAGSPASPLPNLQPR